MKLFRQDGTSVEVPDDQVGEAFASGDYGLPAGTPVPVRLKSGDVGTVPSEQLQGALAQGAQVTSHDELKRAQAEAKFDTALGMTEAGAAGVARGLSFGLSDPLAIGIAKAVGGKEAETHARETLSDLKEINPLSSDIGEAAGMIAPTLATGGAGAAVEGGEAASSLANALKGVGALSRGTSALGELAEHGAAKLVGTEATTLGGRIAQKAVALGARAGVEGGIISGGDQISEDALGDADTNGGKLLAAVGHGFLLGAAGGALLGGTGEIGRDLLGRAAPTLSGAAEEQAWRTVNGRKAFQKEADKIPGGGKAIGRTLLDDGLVKMGDAIEDAAPRINEARQAQGKKIGDLLDSADANGVTGPNVADIRARIENDVLPDLKKLANTNSGALNRVDDLMNDLDSFAGVKKLERPKPPTAKDVERIKEELFQVHGDNAPKTASLIAEERYQTALKEFEDSKAASGTMTFRQAQDFRTRVDDLIKWTTNPLAPVNETTVALKGIRNAIEDEIVKAGEGAESKLGGSWADDYKAAKLKYRQLIIADKAATDAVERFGANAQLSLTDKIMTGQGLNAGLLHGMFSGHGLGAIAAGGLHGAGLGMITGAASKWMRTRGNATGAVLLDKLAALGGIQKAIARVDAEIDRGVDNLVGSGSRVKAKTRAPSFDSHEERVKAVMDAVTQPDAHADAVSSAVAPLMPHAPKIGTAFQRAAIRTTAMLAAQAPKQPTPISLTPHLDEERVSDAEKAKYDRLAHMAHDPVGATFGAIDKGTLTKAEVQFLRDSNPPLYADMVKRITAKLSTSKKRIPYGKQLQLETFLGSSDPTTTPDYVAAMQHSFGAPQQGGHGGGGGHQSHGAPKRVIKGLDSAQGLSGTKVPGT